MPQNQAQNGTLHLAPGDKLDHYTIVEQLGAGGTSIVWKAYDALVDRHVAIKQLLFTGRHEDDLLAQRFRREAALLRKLSESHPRIVHIHQLIDDQRGAFIIMEYVAGQSLEQLLSQSGDPIDPLKTLKLIHAVANVLSVIHEQGVVHRDLKPSNLLLPTSGGVKVCDLGLAALIAEQEALPAGSVRYMAPELFQGGPITPAADIYALGVIAYEMLAGRAAFNDVFKAVLRDQRNQSMRWMKWHTNPRAAAPPLKQVNPQINQRFSDLVARMMEKDLDKRVRSARELIDAINRHITPGTGTPGTSAPAPGSNKTTAADARTAPPAEGNLVEKTAELPRKKRWPLYTAAGVIIAVSLALGYITLDKQARQRAAREAIRTQVAALLDEGGAHYQAGRFAEALASYEQAGRIAPDKGDMHKRGEAGVLLSGARISMDAGRLTEARTRLDELDAMNVVSRNTIYELYDEIDRREAFNRDADAIAAAIDAGDTSAARERLNAYRGKVLSPSESATLRDLSVRLSSVLNSAFVQQALAEADRLAPDDRAAAITLLGDALKRYDAAALSGRLAELQLEAKIEQLQQSVKTAEDAGNLDAAITAQRELAELQPTDEARRKLASLQAARATQRGVERFRAGDTHNAKTFFIEALGYADSPEARGYLARMEVAADFRSLVEAGDKATALGDPDAAVRHYTAALNLSEDPAVRDKLTAARVQQELAAAERHARAHDHDTAREAYRNALALDPANAPAQEGLRKLDQLDAYLAKLKAGDDRRAQGRFADARRAYEAARDILATDEVRRRLDDTEYEQLVAQGRAYIDLEQWPAARATLRQAAKIKPSDTVRSLLAEIEKNQPKEAGDG